MDLDVAIVGQSHRPIFSRAGGQTLSKILASIGKGNPVIYLDHAATTALLPEAVEAMMPLLTRDFGNPSGVHAASRIARDHLESAREEVAACLGADPHEIIFTGGGTEANALAILGLAELQASPAHLICSQIEHPAVRAAVALLEARGHEVTWLRPDHHGRIESTQVRDALTPQTFLVTLMLGNNEIGTLQPVGEISELCEEHGVAFHCDAVQAVGKVPLDLARLPLTSMALSGHKFGGPKGVGALFVRRGHRLAPLIPGGGQERKLRSGTQNVPGAVGLATALRLSTQNLIKNSAHLTALRDSAMELMLTLPGVHLTGHPTLRLPHIASFRVDQTDGESLVVYLDSKGICVSTGSACSSGTVQASPVLLACGLKEVEARGSLRLSVGLATTQTDIELAASALRDFLSMEG